MQTNPKIIMEEDKPTCAYKVIREQEQEADESQPSLI